MTPPEDSLTSLTVSVKILEGESKTSSKKEFVLYEYKRENRCDSKNLGYKETR